MTFHRAHAVATLSRGLVCAAAALLVVNCAPVQSKDRSFLTSYDGLEQASKFKDEVVFEADRSKWKNYDKLHLEEVKVFLPAKAAAKRKITEADVQRLEETFRSALAAEVQKTRFTLVSETGRRTLALRAGVVDIKAGSPTGFAVTYLPYVSLVTGAAGLATGSNLGAGSATIETEILDSVTRERLFALIDRNPGSKLQIIQGMSRWGHVETAFKEWSKALRKRLQTQP